MTLAEDGSGRSGLFWWKGTLLPQPEMLVLLAGCADPRLAQALVLYDYYFFGLFVIRFRDNLLCD